MCLNRNIDRIVTVVIAYLIECGTLQHGFDSLSLSCTEKAYL